MADKSKSKMKVILAGTVLTWTERASGREVFRFDCETVAAPLRASVFAYGCKQIIADGAAGATDPAKAMRERAETLVAGTWGERVARFPDADVWAAMVALGLTKDSIDKRDKWASLKPAERRAVARLPEIAAWLVDNTPEPPNVAELLAGL